MSRRFGLLGFPLVHSRSPAIHRIIYRRLGLDARYDLFETAPEELSATLARLGAAGIGGLNVTIPHKTAVMALLDDIDPGARAIGAVNTVSFGPGGTGHDGTTRGLTKGWNTDADGFRAECDELGLGLAGKSAVILGHGGAARPVVHVLREAGAARVTLLGRDGTRLAAAAGEMDADCCTFAEAEAGRLSGDLLVNCTPVGMFPHQDASPVSGDFVGRFAGVVDLIYNPAETRLMALARERGIRAANGFFMLVAQAVRAAGIWTGQDLGPEFVRAVHEEALASGVQAAGPAPACRMAPEPPGPAARRPDIIFLTGMPGAGKTTVGRLLAERSGAAFVDLDDLIVEREGRSVAELFAIGEERFREAEAAALRAVTEMAGGRQGGGGTEQAGTGSRAGGTARLVVATGGGIILRAGNVRLMQETGTIVFLDRPLAAIAGDIDSGSRPLLKDDPTRLARLYESRYPVYRASCDLAIGNGRTPDDAVREILAALRA